MAGRVLLLVAAGLGLGLALAAPVAASLKPYLFGVTERDAGAYLATVVLLAVVALVVTVRPAQRLRRVSPTTVLSAE